jgi:hypothetical protein
LGSAERALAEALHLEQSINSDIELVQESLERLRSQLDSAQRQARGARLERLAAERELASARRHAARLDLPDTGPH